VTLRAFDLLYLDSRNVMMLPLAQRAHGGSEPRHSSRAWARQRVSMPCRACWTAFGCVLNFRMSACCGGLVRSWRDEGDKWPISGRHRSLKQLTGQWAQLFGRLIRTSCTTQPEPSTTISAGIVRGSEVASPVTLAHVGKGGNAMPGVSISYPRDRATVSSASGRRKGTP
jgi:hypothetical protein